MPMHHRFSRLPVVASLFLLPALLTGCAANSTATSGTAALHALALGNWQISAAAAGAVPLPALSGELSGASNAVSGMLHSQSASACVAPASAFEVSGSADKTGLLTLTGPVAGGTLTLTGTLSADGKSLSNASYNVKGGSCAFAKPATATAQSFTPINGTYNGSFTDPDGAVATVSANLTQSPSTTTTGNYTLSGTATLPNNPCFSSSNLTVSNTQVTGGTFSFTFTDPTTTASVTASGTFSPDATTLTVNPWTLSHCSTDSGQGSMAKQ